MSHNKPIRCTEYWKRMHVFVDGNVYPCCYSKQFTSSMGNVNDSSLKEIWNSEAAQKHRQNMIDGNYDEMCWEWCPILKSGSLSEDKLQVTQGPEAFVANQELCNSEISQRKVQLQSVPQYHRFVPSLKCNLRCIMCFQDRKDTRELPAAYFDDLAAWYQYTETINLQGGEPFCCDACLRLLEEMDFETHPQIRFRVITNATLITDGVIEKMRRAKFLSVLVSVNAATPETYKEIMKGARWDKTMKNIQRLVDFRDSLDEPFTIGLSFVVMQSNVNDLPHYPDLGKRFRVNPNVVPLRFDPGGENLFDTPEGVECLKHNLNLMESRSRELGVTVGTGQIYEMIKDHDRQQKGKV